MASIILVGSGVAGTLLARRLLESENGHHITIFEAGPDFKTGDHRTWLDHLMADKNPYDEFMDDPRTRTGDIELYSSRLFVKGGTTNHWGGWSLRFKPKDFELKSRTGQDADWPITYDDLAVYYTQAEHLLGIEGDSGDDDPPRYGQKFPFEAAPYTLIDMPLIEALEELGISYSHMPLARNGIKCVTTGTCRYCPVNARYTAAFDLSELKEKYGRKLDVHTDSPVLEVRMRGKKHATGVRFLNRKLGRHESMEGDMVVVCSGTVESTKLLLSSANADWPEGIGNDSGHVGQHLLGHPLVTAEGVKRGNPDRIEQELGFITLASRHYDSPKYQREGKMLFAKENTGRTNIAGEILNNNSRSKIDAKMASKMTFRFYASVEQFESPTNQVRLGKGEASFGLRGTKIDYRVHDTTKKAMRNHAQRLTKILVSAGCKEESIEIDSGGPTGAHLTSTCRMSSSAADGVVDKELRVHGTDNLYVSSNAVFPTVTAVNPTLTVAAFAVRLGEHLKNLGV